MLERIDGMERFWLRRYAGGSKCAGPMGYHDATFLLGDFPEESINVPDKHDGRWPSSCSCGYEFQNSDSWQLFDNLLYKRSDSGETLTIREAPAGAMWFAKWLDQKIYWDNGEGPCLYVQTPGGEWNIDSRASNCALPNDRTHRCWVRHGDAPNITVDKNGKTCSAGAGSIMCGKYHGFLRNGELT